MGWVSSGSLYHWPLDLKAGWSVMLRQGRNRGLWVGKNEPFTPSTSPWDFCLADAVSLSWFFSMSTIPTPGLIPSLNKMQQTKLITWIKNLKEEYKFLKQAYGGQHVFYVISNGIGVSCEVVVRFAPYEIVSKSSYMKGPYRRHVNLITWIEHQHWRCCMGIRMNTHGWFPISL